MFYLIISNDRLKNKKHLKKFNTVKEVFDKAGIEYEIRLTDHRGHVRELTKEITSGADNSVIIMGGDGTLHEAINGFNNFKDNKLGFIPVGTGNDFAASANIPLNAKKAAEIILNGSVKPVDFIQLSSGLRSLNAVGMGIDVDVLKCAYSGKNNKKSKYLRALITCLARFKSYEFSVLYDGKEQRHSGLIAAVGNGRQFGGGIKMFPGATIDDGYLDLIICDFVSKPRIIGAFIKLMRGKIHKLKESTALKVKQVTFIPHADFSIEADGELYDNNGLDVSVSDEKLLLYTTI